MTNTAPPRTILTCLRCGWQWFSRAAHPRQCPHCYSSFWDGRLTRLRQPTATEREVVRLRQQDPSRTLQQIAESLTPPRSRERVRQILKKHGLDQTRTMALLTAKTASRCDGCGAGITQARYDRLGFCVACYRLSKRVTILCRQCDNTRGIYRMEHAAEAAYRALHPSTATGRPRQKGFCSQACLGRWEGQHYGWPVHKNKNRQTWRAPRPLDGSATCAHGHPWTLQTTSMTKQGYRKCTPCFNAANQRYYHRSHPAARYNKSTVDAVGAIGTNDKRTSCQR